MGASRCHPPNRRLTWSRLQRGWSYDELAAQVTASMKAHGEPDTGLTGNTVRRWEMGERWPEPRFRKHLVLMFDRTANDLGLLTPEELAVRPDDDNNNELDVLRRLTSMATGQVGDHRLSRQAFLRGVLGVGLLPGIAPLGALAEAMEALTHAVDRPSHLAQDSVTAYTWITTTQQQLYWTSPAAPMFESSLAHTQLGLHMLRNTGAGVIRKQLIDSAAQSALLSARLAFFDLRHIAVAVRCFDFARQLAQEAEDQALTAAVYGHMAFVPGFAGDQPTAVAVLDAAYRHGTYAAAPRLRSWLHCVNAEITTRNGDPKTGMVRVRQAEDALATNGTDPVWLDFYNPSRLKCFAGYVQLAAGAHVEAAATLEDALGNLVPNTTKQQCVLLLDLATAYAPTDAEHAVQLATHALDTLQQDAYATAQDRIPAVRAGLQDVRRAAELDERIALVL